MTQAQLVKHLDSAARRASMINATPASSKQTWFLAGLLVKVSAKLNDESAVNEWLSSSAVLTLRDASKQIEIALSVLN